MKPELMKELLLTDEEIGKAKIDAFHYDNRLSPTAFNMFGRDQAVAQAQLSAIEQKGYHIVKVDDKLREWLAKELYDFAGRYGGHQGFLWANTTETIQRTYRSEADQIIALIKGE